MFNGPAKAANSTTALSHYILNKCCWKMLRRSLTIFDSPRNNSFRLCRDNHMIKNGNNYKEVIKQQRLCGNIFRRMYTAKREEITSLVVADNKTLAMSTITSLQEKIYEYSSSCKPNNIKELWCYYVKQKQKFLNSIPIYLHLNLLTSLYEIKETEKVLIIIKYLRGRENIVKWLNNNLIILECIIKLNIEEAIEKFDWLNTMEGNLPTDTVSHLISLLMRSNEIATAEELFGKVGKRYENVKIYNSLMNGYVKERNLEKTLYLLEMMQRNGIKPNLATYNILLKLFGKMKAQNEAEQVFEDMMEIGIQPDRSSYCGIMTSCANNNNVEKCFYYFKHMIGRGIEPTIYHYSIIMSACVKAGYAREAIKLFERMVYGSKIKPNAIVLTTLMRAWTQIKPPIRDLDRIFGDIKKIGAPDLIAYTALINGKTKQLKLEEAILVYQQMLRDEIKPNVYTYTTLLDACAKLRDLKTALKLFEDMKKSGIAPNQYTYCSIMDAYINNGQLSNAFRMFEEMKQNGLKPDIACINCLMDACNRSGSMSLLFQLYSDLTEKYNLTPDNGTVSIYIDACTYNNYFNVGKTFYRNLVKNKFPFQITLNNQNFLSIINLLGRNGYASEIVKVLRIMKQRLIKPNRLAILVIFNYLYELNKRKEIEAANRILDGWTTIPKKIDLIKFKSNYRW